MDELKIDKRLGCLKRDYRPLIGKKFSHLTLLEIIPLKIMSSKRRSQVGIFKCDCNGPNKEIEITRVVNGEQASCCGFKNKKFAGEIPGHFISKIRVGARSRNYEYSLTNEYIWELFLKQERKCALSGVELKFSAEYGKSKNRIALQNASLDRIDSSKGYIEGNVQWVHKDVNQMKMDLDQDYFINLCKKIAEKN